MNEVFLASTPQEQWPGWARNLAEAGHITQRGGITSVKHSDGHVSRCRPGDYIGLTLGGAPVVMSAAVYEGSLRA